MPPTFTSRTLAFLLFFARLLVSHSSLHQTPHDNMHFSSILLLPLALIGAVAAGPIVEKREPGNLEA